MAEDIKKTGERSKLSENFAINEEEVHVMPKKFVIKNPKKKDGGAKGIVVFFVIFFLLLLAGLAIGYYFLQVKNKPQNENTNVNQNINTNINSNTNTSTNTNVNINTNSNTNNSTTTNTNTNSNTNTNTNTNTVVNPPAVTITVDTDQDGLTDLEEQTYQADGKNADSDKDGYKDGDEVKNLYSPLTSLQTLIDSSLVIRYKNDVFHYEIFSPKAWLIKAIDDSRQKIEFIPDNSTSDLVRISVLPNPDKKNLSDWQKTIFGTQSMENFRLGSQAALRSIDKRQVLVVSADYVYTIVYEASGSGANFVTTFEMMLNSFTLINSSL
ncbi:MAG: hypothetical protein QG603_222 [Patescibacteria group bacterium]|nr:hypothetical protein [Patescibacteria group bacterium]